MPYGIEDLSNIGAGNILLLDTKPLSEPILTCSELDLLEQTSVNFWLT